VEFTSLLLLLDLESIAAASKTFSNAMTDLADACGEKTLVKLSNKLFTLISFTILYMSLKSAIAFTKVIQVETTMDGIFFLRGFRNNDSLAA
jgi:hypothetical protein